MRIKLILCFLLLTLLLAACSAGGFPFNLFATATPTAPMPTSTITLTSTRTATLTPTISLTPTITRTPTVTFTASITPTPTITATQIHVLLGSRLESPFGYSLQVPMGFTIDSFEELDGIYWLSNAEMRTVMYIVSIDYYAELSVDEMMMIVEHAVKIVNPEVTNPIYDDAMPLTIDGIEGLSVAWTGINYGEPVDGRVAAIPQEGYFLFILCTQSTGLEKWDSEGSAVFQAVANSIKLSKPELTSCLLAEDETYGLSPENPIRIGGGEAGWDRIQKFFYGLNEPGGFKTVHYQWTESISRDGTTLDVYLAYYETQAGTFGPETSLYFDRYSYEPPMAPQGFKCMGSYFPFDEP